jgi:hypothetical protein
MPIASERGGRSGSRNEIAIGAKRRSSGRAGRNMMAGLDRHARSRRCLFVCTGDCSPTVNGLSPLTVGTADVPVSLGYLLLEEATSSRRKYSRATGDTSRVRYLRTMRAASQSSSGALVFASPTQLPQNGIYHCFEHQKGRPECGHGRTSAPVTINCSCRVRALEILQHRTPVPARHPWFVGTSKLVRIVIQAQLQGKPTDSPLQAAASMSWASVAQAELFRVLLDLLSATLHLEGRSRSKPKQHMVNADAGIIQAPGRSQREDRRKLKPPSPAVR